MGLVIPGFVPSPLGEIVEYAPSFTEFCVSAAIWALGALIYTLLLKAAVPIELGTLRTRRRGAGRMTRRARAPPARCWRSRRAATRRIRPPSTAVEPPVASPEAIPDAPVSGRIHGAPFALRDARYVVDRRVGLRAHRHRALVRGGRVAVRAGLARARRRACGCGSTGPAQIESTNVRVGPGRGGHVVGALPGVRRRGAGSGVGEGSALAVAARARARRAALRGASPCASRTTRRAACRARSTPSGCPPTIDQPVRGTPPPEAIPPQYLQRVAK